MVAPSRIAFGSCNDQDLQNNMWPLIEKRDPAAFIWGGDAIYADYHLPTDWTQFPPTAEHKCADPGRLRELYKQQKAVPGYKRLLKTNATIFGTFDDHDYGCNNADRSYEFRYESGIEFVNFLGQSLDSPMSRRARDGLGVYGVKLFDFSRQSGMQEVSDEEASIDPYITGFSTNSTGFSSAHSTYSNQSVAVFVLDVRSNKSPWKQGKEAFVPDFEGDFLGEHQWQWFETAISRSRAAANVVVSGLQFHANIFPDPNVAEAWGKFPRAQQRLFDAVLHEGVQAPILISGDVHMTQLMRKDCERADGNVPRRSLVEMTTSGMTHAWGTVSTPPLANPRQKPSLQQRYDSFVSGAIMSGMHYVSHWTDLLVSSPPTEDGLHPSGGGDGAKEGLQYSLERNFGELEFDWEQRTVAMRSMGEQPGVAPLLQASWTMDQLSGNDAIPGSLLSSQDFADEANGSPVRFAHGSGGWVCVSHRGSSSFLQQMISFASVSAATGFTTLLPYPMILPCLIFALLFLRKLSRMTKGSSSRPVY